MKFGRNRPMEKSANFPLTQEGARSSPDYS
jgi:hypothetical protein